MGINRVTRLENVSLLGALSHQGLIASMSVKGSVDTNVFLTYLTQVLLPELWEGAIVVLDNLKVHHAAGKRQIIEAAGARERISTTLFSRLISN